MGSVPDNEELAELCERIAELLEAQGADGYRVRAWRAAAHTVRGQGRSLAELYAELGVKGLVALPAIGKSIAGAIENYLNSGRSSLLARLEGQITPQDLFATVPGVGEELAHRLHQDLGVETLEELEIAAHDGRLESVPGFGPGRARMVRDGLAGMLSRSAKRRARLFETRRAPVPVPPVELLLAIDEDYRRHAEAGELTTIAPRRFNPTGESWLPIWRPERDGFPFTVVYSNTARAHELGHTHDWVVIHFEQGGREGQATVVTETHGPLVGQRVVRGREEECAATTQTADRSVSGGTP